MNTSLIVTLNKHHVYYINGNKLSFYIAIPYKEFSSTNITLEFNPNYEKFNPNNNDSVWIKDEITNIYKEIDEYNISLIIPVFYDNSLKQTDSVVDQNLYLNLDANISSVINNSYQILSKSNVSVDKTIYLINNGFFNNFTKWFLQRYGSRIALKNYNELEGNVVGITNSVQQPYSNPVNNPNVQIQSQSPVPESTSSYTAVSNNMQQPTLNPGLQFVTGETFNQGQVIEPTINSAPEYMNNTPTNANVEVPDSGSAGFVSYLLLGIITVIICLGILYIML